MSVFLPIQPVLPVPPVLPVLPILPVLPVLAAAKRGRRRFLDAVNEHAERDARFDQCPAGADEPFDPCERPIVFRQTAAVDPPSSAPAPGQPPKGHAQRRPPRPLPVR